MRGISIGLVAALWCAGAGVAAAAPGVDGARHREGEYGGVSPEGPPVTDAKHSRPAAKTLGWIGFSAKAGAGEVFFQAAQPFTVGQRVEGGALVVSLDGLTKLGRNTRRPLDTRFFDSPIARISTRTVRATRGKQAHRAGVEVRVAFKQAGALGEAQVRTAQEPDGLYYAYLTFAATSSAPPSTSAPAAQPE